VRASRRRVSPPTFPCGTKKERQGADQDARRGVVPGRSALGYCPAPGRPGGVSAQPRAADTAGAGARAPAAGGRQVARGLSAARGSAGACPPPPISELLGGSAG